MEPAQESVKEPVRINYIVLTEVVKVEALHGRWYIHFDGSRESIAFGYAIDPAPFATGDQVKITFEKVQA